MFSLFELFKIGIGPSSSHTVGPMIAAQRFSQSLLDHPQLKKVAGIAVDLYGSLALTGRGHATDRAVLAGLMGMHPASVDIDAMNVALDRLNEVKELDIGGNHRFSFDPAIDLVFHYDKALPYHPNAVRFTASDVAEVVLHSQVFYSVGGGFVVSEDEANASAKVDDSRKPVPFDFQNGAQLLAMCRATGLRIDEIVHQNELVWRTEEEISKGCDLLWETMESCIDRGMATEGILPGGLHVKRRASGMAKKLKELAEAGKHPQQDPMIQNDWLSMFAFAVNEENAAGGRVVTAPTNGAAGVIPAVLAYYVKFFPGANREGIHRFLKTATAIGLLYKRNASLSAAEMGCQGEVGVACSMAAAGLAACMGGTVNQIENAAEIGMEHNLGMTCDPISGLVQIPCIERNTKGALFAINAARLAVLYGDGSHRVSLDSVIETMRQTGVDMQSKYKETSLGGLAVNVVNC